MRQSKGHCIDYILSTLYPCICPNCSVWYLVNGWGYLSTKVVRHPDQLFRELKVDPTTNLTEAKYDNQCGQSNHNAELQFRNQQTTLNIYYCYYDLLIVSWNTREDSKHRNLGPSLCLLVLFVVCWSTTRSRCPMMKSVTNMESIYFAVLL